MPIATGMFSLKGKRALVTGGAGELGFGFAQVLQVYGAQVTIIDASAATARVAASLHTDLSPVYGVQADISDKAQASQAFDQAVERMGGLDILVNGAGIQRRCPAAEFPAKDWDDVLTVNLSATFFMCQNSARLMIPRRSGKIINIASMTSYVGMKFIPAYAASKGGVMQLTKALSNEWAEHGVQVNAIAPGYFNTRMNAAYLDPVNADLYQGITQRIPAARWGEVSDLKGALVFLASAASDYVSGVTLPVDGGFLGR